MSIFSTDPAVYLQRAAEFQTTYAYVNDQIAQGDRVPSEHRVGLITGLFRQFLHLDLTYTSVVKELRLHGRTRELAALEAEHTNAHRAARAIFPEERLTSALHNLHVPKPYQPLDSPKIRAANDLKALLSEEEVTLEQYFDLFVQLDPKVQLRCYEFLCQDEAIHEGVDLFLQDPKCLLPVIAWLGENGRPLKTILEQEHVDLQAAFDAFSRLSASEQRLCYNRLCKEQCIDKGIDLFLENPRRLLTPITTNRRPLPMIDQLILETHFNEIKSHAPLFVVLFDAIKAKDAEATINYFNQLNGKYQQIALKSFARACRIIDVENLSDELYRFVLRTFISFILGREGFQQIEAAVFAAFNEMSNDVLEITKIPSPETLTVPRSRAALLERESLDDEL